MKILSFITILFIFFTAHSQQEETKKDIFKNNGYFNITKFTHYRINNANLEFIDADNRITRVNVKEKKSHGNGLQTINGYFITNNLSVGLGIALERFNNPNANTFPIFLDTRYYLINGYNTFYVFGDLGLLAKLDNTFRKGGLLNCGLGYKFFIDPRKSLAVVTDIGYYHRLIKVPFDNNPNISDLTVNGFSFSIGVLF